MEQGNAKVSVQVSAQVNAQSERLGGCWVGAGAGCYNIIRITKIVMLYYDWFAGGHCYFGILVI